MDAYIISLKNRNEQNSQELIKTISNIGLNPVWFDGINGKTIDIDKYKKHLNQNYIQILTPSIIGCALSHLYVWKKIEESNAEYAVIFEDDVIFEDEVKKNFNIALKNSPKDFDILMLGYLDNSNPLLFLMNLLTNSTKLKKEKINDYWDKPRCLLQTHAYMVSKSGVKKLIKLIDGYIYQHIDFMINQKYLNDNVNVYALNNRIAYQKSFKEESSNVSHKYPIEFFNVCKNIYLDNKFPLSYLLNVDMISLGYIEINLMSIIFLIMGIIIAIYNIDILYVLIIALIISISDIRYIINNKDIKHFKRFIFILVVLILPSLIKNEIKIEN